VTDLDTARVLPLTKTGSVPTVTLEVPIADDKQSAHLRIAGALKDASYRIENGDLMFDRPLRGLRNTVLLPAGWDVSAISQSGTIGTYDGRAFVALINLNAENNYKVTIRARSDDDPPALCSVLSTSRILTHSDLSACMTSTRAARAAGRTDATTAATSSTAAAPASGSAPGSRTSCT
jgi:hypothetical protein